MNENREKRQVTKLVDNLIYDLEHYAILNFSNSFHAMAQNDRTLRVFHI